MKSTPLLCAGAAVILGLSASCASATRKRVYDSSQVGQIIREKRGEVIAVQDVIIKPSDGSIIRGGTGAQIGAGAGAAILTGSVVRAGAAVGSAIGRNIGSVFDEKAGEEITLRLDEEAEVIIVVQERDGPPLAPGERVKLQTTSRSGSSTISILRGTGGTNRVVRDTQFTDGGFSRDRQIAQSR